MKGVRVSTRLPMSRLVRMVKYLLKEKGLKIEAACDQIKAGPSAIMRKNRAVLRLKEARDRLQAMLDALNSRR